MQTCNQDFTVQHYNKIELWFHISETCENMNPPLGVNTTPHAGVHVCMHTQTCANTYTDH